MQPDQLQLPPDRLRARCDPAIFTFTTTVDLPAPPRMIGQERAAEALEFGLEVPDSRYNIFVAGPPGTGRSIATEAAARAAAAKLPVPNDWCYVHNFDTPYVPRAIMFPAGRARKFAQDVDTLIEDGLHAIDGAFDNENYRRLRADALKPLADQRNELRDQLESVASAQAFAVVSGDNGPDFIPLKPGAEPGAPPTPYAAEEFEALPEAEKADFRQRYGIVQDKLIDVVAASRRLGLQERTRIRELDATFARETIAPLFDALRANYQDVAAVPEHLASMLDDIVDNVNRLRSDSNSSDADNATSGSDGADPAAQMASMGPSWLTRYRVNVLIDNSGLTSAPFINEHNPTYYNLAGRLEYSTRMGSLYTDFSFIKPGALHQANGGILILNARELLTSGSAKAWEVLKRSLRMSMVTIENLADPQQVIAMAASLKPMTIPLNVKVIMVGDLETWSVLNESDPEFRELFKVRSDFEESMPRNPQTTAFYAQLTGDIARELQLPPLSRTAVALIVEEGSRMVDDQTKLSTSITSIRDLVIEAGFFARKSNLNVIDAANVDQATKMRRRRMGLIEERLDERVRKGLVIITTTGNVVGQINGLGVLSALGATFGQPLRITARTAPGFDGVMDIARETEISGPAHSKGVLTLIGYLTGRYGQEQPLSLTASLAFEQIYDGIDGDSASLAELCALISALSEVPIRQGLAVTGSVNQRGEVQAVGGVNDKIEGFFDTCIERNELNGTQGVIIPASTIYSLMLRLDVVTAVREGAFHIFAINHVDEALELLTGRPAGRPNASGDYLSNTVNALVLDKLHDYAERVKRYRQNDR